MKIFAVINNYREDGPGADLLHPFRNAGEKASWYMLTESCMVRAHNPFFVPDFDTSFAAFPSICLRVSRLGKNVARRFADRYVDGWTMAAAVVATDLLGSLRSRGLPWTEAVAFDRSCILGNLEPIDTLKEYDTLQTACGEAVRQYRIDHLKESWPEVVEKVSAYNTIKNGDLILVGLTDEGLPLVPGSKLTAGFSHTEHNNLIQTNIR